jgi:Mrp family chromosome partitioning ATPase
VGDGSEIPLGELLTEIDGVDTVISASPAASATTELSDGKAIGYLIVVQWGKTSHEQLSSALAALRASNPAALGMVLEGVPRADLDWAGVSTHGSLVETAS